MRKFAVVGLTVLSFVFVWCLQTHAPLDRQITDGIDSTTPTRAGEIAPHPGVVDWRLLPMNQGSAPTENFGSEGFRSIVFAVLSDGVLEERLRAAFGSWLRDSFHTFVYFSDVPRSRASASAFQRENVSVILLPPPPAFRFGNWKNLLIVQHLASDSARRQLQARSGRGDAASVHPSWFVIVDDDTYLLQPAVAYVLRRLHAKLEANSGAMVYAGHTVVRCPRCKNVNKRFSFAFGGNGIFLSGALLLALAARVPECIPLFSSLPGDEQIGGCIHRSSLARLEHLSVGTETFAMPFGDKTEVLTESPFPFAFHRITIPSWHRDMAELERRHSGTVLTWPVIAQYFLEEHGRKYNRVEHVFRETMNTSAVRQMLLLRANRDKDSLR